MLGIVLNYDELESAEFIFWPKYDDGTEPDLVLIAGNYYVLIEDKYFSDFGKENDKTDAQLIRELKGGFYEAENLGKEFRIITVTADYYKKNEKFKLIPEEFKENVFWTNWQKICLLIENLLESDFRINKGDRLFAKDLYLLLLRKNLVEFSGVKRFDSINLNHLYEENIFFNSGTANYRGDFIGFINVLKESKKIRKLPDFMFFSNSIKKFFNFKADFSVFEETEINYIFYKERDKQ